MTAAEAEPEAEAEDLDARARAELERPGFQELRGMGIHAFPVYGTEALAKVLSAFQSDGDVLNPHTGEVQRLGEKFRPTVARDVVDVTDEGSAPLPPPDATVEAQAEDSGAQRRRRRRKNARRAEERATPQVPVDVDASSPDEPRAWAERPAEKWRWAEDGRDTIVVTLDVTDADRRAALALAHLAAPDVAAVHPEDVAVRFTERGVVLRVQRPASRVVHVLRVSDLARPIDPDRCTVACRAAGGPDGTQAVTARLATSDPTTAWGPSLTARPGSFFALR